MGVGGGRIDGCLLITILPLLREKQNNNKNIISLFYKRVLKPQLLDACALICSIHLRLPVAQWEKVSLDKQNRIVSSACGPKTLTAWIPAASPAFGDGAAMTVQLECAPCPLTKSFCNMNVKPTCYEALIDFCFFFFIVFYYVCAGANVVLFYMA